MNDRGAEEPPTQDEAKRPRALRPDHGLGRWITQGAIVSLSAWGAFAVAELLARALWAVPFGIATAPVTAGMYLMALRRYRGAPAGLRDLWQVRRYALQAMLLALSVNLVPHGLYYIGRRVGPDLSVLNGEARMWYLGVTALYILTRLPIGAAAFYAMPLIVDRGMGGWEALKKSWSVTRGDYWSYLGMECVVLLLSVSGGVVVGVGVLITGPMARCAKASAYMYHFGRAGDANESGAE